VESFTRNETTGPDLSPSVTRTETSGRKQLLAAVIPGWHFDRSLYYPFPVQNTYSAVYGTLTVSPSAGVKFAGGWPP
jgi:hypothetical protein